MASPIAQVIHELATQVIGPAKESILAFDNAIEDHLQRIDEISAIVDSLRLEIQHTSDTAFPILLQNCQELAALYSVIDRAELSVERTASAAQAAEERLAVLQQGFQQRFPEGISRITSLFGKARASDGPVKLPAYDPSTARVSVSAELEALRAEVGVVAAVDTSSLDAFVAIAAADVEEHAVEDGAAVETVEPVSAAAAVPQRGRRIAAGEDEDEDDDD